MPTNSINARLRKLEQRVVAMGPSKAEKVCYLLISREQYEEAMAAIGRSEPFENKTNLVLAEAEWRNNDKLRIVELE